MSKKNRKMNQVVEADPQVTKDVETAEVKEATTEIVELPKKKDGLLKKVKTCAENLALDTGLWWGRNKKKVAIAAGIVGGVVLAGLALKDDGEVESDYELSDEEVDDVDSSDAGTDETEDSGDTESETVD